jgi:hypothetical protein
MLKSSREVLIILVLIALVATIAFPSTLVSIVTKPVFGDGLTQEQLTASMGNRKADLLIKMIPPVVTTETLQKGQKPIVEFRLFDPNTNQSFSHVTYYIIVEKDGKRLLSEWFHAHNGDLGIKMEPNTINKTITVYGEQDPVQYTYIGTPSNPVIASGPIFLEGGLYHFIVKIETIDSDEAYLPSDKQPIYDSWLSIGNVYANKWDYQNHNYNTTLISYYDKINHLNFDPANKVFSWSMPFNWNSTRIKQQPIFIHEEMRLPKNWKGLGDNTQFKALVNGQPLSGHSLTLDPFSFPDAMVVHYVVNKNDLIKLAQQVNNVNNNNKKTNATGIMKFSLASLGE